MEQNSLSISLSYRATSAEPHPALQSAEPRDFKRYHIPVYPPGKQAQQQAARRPRLAGGGGPWKPGSRLGTACHPLRPSRAIAGAGVGRRQQAGHTT